MFFIIYALPENTEDADAVFEKIQSLVLWETPSEEATRGGLALDRLQGVQGKDASSPSTFLAVKAAKH